MGYKETGLWMRTLGEQPEGDPQAEARARLRSAYEEFRASVKPLGQEVSQSVPGYTDHSIEHCDSLWDTAELVTGPDYPINPAEAFVLGGAFLIHDLAMGLAAYSGGLPQIIQSEAWKDLLWAEWGERAELLQTEIESDVDANPTWDGLTSPAVKRTMTNFLREHHAEEAEDLLKKEWSLSSGEPFFLLSSTEIRHWYSEVIGKVARSHWLDVQELDSYLPAPFGAPSFLPGEWTIDPVKVACILRLADAAQIDSRRAHPLHTPFRQPQGDSLPHWEFQEMMLLPHHSEGRIVFTSSKSFDESKAEAWWLCYDTVSMINQELQGVDSLCADHGKPRMQCRSAAGAESPERFAKYVPTAGWNPIDARPRIRNPIRVIEQLGGRALYGNEDDVPIRELLANATDAARARAAAQGSASSVPATKIEFYSDADDFFVRVRDYGIGMTADDVAQHLCDFGSSGWRSKRFRSEYPGALASGYSSTGRFGIGFFSVFMIADNVRVRTRSLQGSWDDTFVLEFRSGIAHRPVLRQAEKYERLHEPGTEVTLQLLRNPVKRRGLLYSNHAYDTAKQVAFIRSLAFTAKHPISVSPLGSEEWIAAIDDQPWYEKTAREIYEAVHWDPMERLPPETHALAADYYEKALTPLLGDNDEVRGMLCTTAMKFGARGLNAAVGYCGGFKSGDVAGLSGVVEGQVVKASRDGIFVGTTLEHMEEWLDAQWARHLPPDGEATPEVLLRINSFASGFCAERTDAPLAIMTNGLITGSELFEWIAAREQFTLIEIGSPRFLDIPSLKRWIYYGEDLLQLADDTVAVMYELRDFEDGLPQPLFEDPFDDDWVDGELAEQLEEEGTFWWISYNTPLGAVGRLACQAWGIEVRDLLLSHTHGIAELSPETDSPARTFTESDTRLTWHTFEKPAG